MNKMSKQIVFALFGDGEFISWTYGLFTQLSSFPKVYNESERQIDIVVDNFKSKIRRLNSVSTLSTIDPALSIIDNNQNREKEMLSKYKVFELKMYYFESDLSKINLEKPIRIFKYD